jgi:outer membrane protein assembly factor BamB
MFSSLLSTSKSLIILSFFFYLFSLFLSACSDSGTNPTPQPPGYQEDIPWPSLADSPWPMYHHDPQNTGRTNYPGPTTGNMAWEINSLYATGGVVIGEDSSIYIVGYQPNLMPIGGLISFDHKGQLKWVFPIPAHYVEYLEYAHPIVANDGTIYTISIFDTVYAINSDGSLKWRKGGFNLQSTNMNIDKKGNLYFIDNNTELVCISPQGAEQWRMPGLDTHGYHEIHMAFSPDGNTLYIPGSRINCFNCC